MRPPDISAWTLHFVVILLNAVVTLAGDLRCYCNLPRCIVKGYMCKSSESGQCFFMLQRNRVTVQGCTDLLPTHRQSCDYSSLAPISGLLPLLRASNPAVICCSNHMCNHDDYATQLEARIEASLKNRSGTPAPPRYWYLPKWPPGRPSGVTEQEVWLKAAVIGVPIAGGFIMLVLLFIAVRILRQDSKLRQKPLNGAGDILVAHSASAAAAAAVACANSSRETRGCGNSGAWLLKHTKSLV